MTGIVHRNTAWTCFATKKGCLTRCAHFNAQGGVEVPDGLDWFSRPKTAIVCEVCGAKRDVSASANWSAKNEHDESGIQRRATATEIARAYQRAEATVRAAYAAIKATESELTATIGAGQDISIRTSQDRSFDDVEHTVNRLRRDVWDGLVDRMEIRRFMSVAEWKAFEKDVESKDPPPITEEALASLFARLVADLPGMQERAVLEVFDWLRPRAEDFRRHRSNVVEAIGKRVVITYAVEQAFSRVGGFTLEYKRWQEITALENVFCALDGAPKPDQGPELRFAIQASADGKGETRWFRFKCFRNRNLHLEFTRPDLVARINQIGGARSLKAAS